MKRINDRRSTCATGFASVRRRGGQSRMKRRAGIISGTALDCDKLVARVAGDLRLWRVALAGEKPTVGRGLAHGHLRPADRFSSTRM